MCFVLTAIFASVLYAMNIAAGIFYGIFAREYYSIFCVICGVIIGTFSTAMFAYILDHSIWIKLTLISAYISIYFWTMTIVATIYDHLDIIPLAIVATIYMILSLIFLYRFLQHN